MRRSMSKPAFPGSFSAGVLLLIRHSEKITDTTHIPPPDWEALIEQIARQIVEERSPQRLLQVRASLYDLLSHCIDSTTIIKTLTWKLIPKTDDALKPEVIKWAAFYEHRCKMGAKQIFHLEAFVAKYMRIYERYVEILNMVLTNANMSSSYSMGIDFDSA
jgi:replication factor C subunit 3/5